MSFFNLPRELLSEISKDLEPSDLSSLAQTSHNFNRVFTPLLHDIAMKDFEQLPALCWAAQQGHEPLARLLLKEGVGIDKADPKTGMTALMFAACRGDIGLARLLVEEGARLDRLDKQGRNPLVWAVKKRRMGVCRLLLGKGADPDFLAPGPGYSPGKDIDEYILRPPLHWAVTRAWDDPRPNISLVELLLEKGAHVDGLSIRGETALYAAARNLDRHNNLFPLYSKITKVLLNAGADVNFRPFTQQRKDRVDAVLHIAVRMASAELVEVLLEGGADANIMGSMGDAPLSIAVRRGNPIIVAALLKNGAKAIYSNLLELSPYGDPRIKELLLQYGANED